MKYSDPLNFSVKARTHRRTCQTQLSLPPESSRVWICALLLASFFLSACFQETLPETDDFRTMRLKNQSMEGENLERDSRGDFEAAQKNRAKSEQHLRDAEREVADAHQLRAAAESRLVGR